MGDNIQAPPPSYADVSGKNVYTEGVATGHPIPQQPQYAEMKYQTVNPTMPVVYGVATTPLLTFNKNPVHCTCPYCQSIIVTRVEETSGLLAWLVCLLLFVFGCWLGCCLIPFCIQDLQNIRHYCPTCHTFLGEYRPL